MVTAAEKREMERTLRSLPLFWWRQRLKEAKTAAEALDSICNCYADCADTIVRQLGVGTLADLTLAHMESGTKFMKDSTRGHPIDDPGNFPAFLERVLTDGGLDTGEEELVDWVARALQDAKTRWRSASTR